MQFQFLSDLHLEHHADFGQNFAKEINPCADTLIMAGDIIQISYLRECMPALREICQKFQQVYWVPGNHEYYKCGGDVDLVQSKMLTIAIPNLRVCIREKINNLIFCTLWYPFHKDNHKFYSFIGDNSHIMNMTWIYEQNYLDQEFIEKNTDQNSAIVTHMLPSYNCIDSKYKGSILNRFFVSPMDKLVLTKKPKLWIFGHTHSPLDLTIGSTRVICNPFGYPREDHNKFNPKLTVQI